LRVESEMMAVAGSVGVRSDSVIPVVHCYGHGGSGITLAMGCAHDVATNHVMSLLQLQPNSRL
jgi:hypothetical protein